MDLQKLRAKLQTECSLDPHRLIVLGFSGGPDSLTLLHLLHQLSLPVLAAHLDHGLRPGSANDARQAQQLAAELGVPFVSQRANAGAYATEHGKSVEEAARELRYRFLFDVAERERAQAVAVAHNANDQAETVLMHLLRGAGPAGLRGMAARALPNSWSETIPLVRPLLGTWRGEIEAYCAKHNLQPLIDESNSDVTYFRNRLRHETLPTLEELAPGFRGRLNQTANLVSADAALIEGLAAVAWRRVLRDRQTQIVRFDRVAFLAEPLALQRALVRMAAGELLPALRDLDFGAVERVLMVAQGARVIAPRPWLSGLVLLAENNDLWFAIEDATLFVEWPQGPAQAVHLEVPAKLPLGVGWQLSVASAALAGERPPADGFHAWLDCDAAGEEFTVRRRKPGDSFQPLGMQGSQKLSDFFVNEKVPQRARDAWPLVCKGEEIVWVPGYRLAHPYRLRDLTSRVIKFKLERA